LKEGKKNQIMGDSTDDDKTHLEQLLDQIPSFRYIFKDGFLHINDFGDNRSGNIQVFVDSLFRNTTPITGLDLSSNS
jgi:hypothetical protein